MIYLPAAPSRLQVEKRHAALRKTWMRNSKLAAPCMSLVRDLISLRVRIGRDRMGAAAADGGLHFALYVLAGTNKVATAT